MYKWYRKAGSFCGMGIYMPQNVQCKQGLSVLVLIQGSHAVTGSNLFYITMVFSKILPGMFPGHEATYILSDVKD